MCLATRFSSYAQPKTTPPFASTSFASGIKSPPDVLLKAEVPVFVLCRIHLWLIATLCVSHNGAVLYAQTAVNALAFVNNRVEKSLAVGLYGYTFFRTNLLTA